jgi:hypothetical protein
MRGDLAHIKAKAKLLFANPKRCAKLPVLFLLTDDERGVFANSQMQLAVKGSVVVVRTYGNDALAESCLKKRGVFISATTEPKSARQLGLHGIHLPNHRLKYFRKSHYCPRLITASAHNLRELLRAKRLGISNILFSPIFPSDSKSTNRRVFGIIKLAKITRDFKSLNFIALGGINQKTLKRLANTNISAIAGVSFSAKN